MLVGVLVFFGTNPCDYGSPPVRVSETHLNAAHLISDDLVLFWSSKSDEARDFRGLFSLPYPSRNCQTGLPWLIVFELKYNTDFVPSHGEYLNSLLFNEHFYC